MIIPARGTGTPKAMPVFSKYSKESICGNIGYESIPGATCFANLSKKKKKNTSMYDTDWYV
jgi:hypothetical protein